LAIQITPLANDKLKAFFLEKKLEFTKNSGCVLAKDNNGNLLGYCAYFLDEQSITIVALDEYPDLFLADGILRSALHVADFRGISTAFYQDTAPVSVFHKLDFIKNEQDKTLKIEKLHQSCCGCSNF